MTVRTESTGYDNSTARPSAPLITLGMRHFNNGPFVEAALRGAFSQTYSPLEIVFVDDASTDGGFEIAQRLAAEYRGPHRLILSRNDRTLGPGGQYERVRALSRGDVIVIADCDDVSLPERCQRIYEAFRDGRPDLLCVDSYFDVIGVDGRLLTGVPADLARNRTGYEGVTAEVLARTGGGPQGAVAAFHRSLFEVGVSLDRLRIGEESVLAFRALVLGRVKTIPEVLVLRRVHLHNISGTLHPDWSGRDLRAWVAMELRRRTPVPGVMQRDLNALQRAGLISEERAGRLRRAARVYARELKLQRVALCHPWWRRWTLFFALIRLGQPWRAALRLTLMIAAPGIALILLRRNPIHRARRPASASLRQGHRT